MIVVVLTTFNNLNSIIVLMFVESQRVHIEMTYKVCKKAWSVVLLNKKKAYTPVLYMTSC